MFIMPPPNTYRGATTERAMQDMRQSEMAVEESCDADPSAPSSAFNDALLQVWRPQDGQVHAVLRAVHARLQTAPQSYLEAFTHDIHSPSEK